MHLLVLSGYDKMLSFCPAFLFGIAWLLHLYEKHCAGLCTCMR